MIAKINRLYRKIFHRGGHGVHSPFVFDLLTTVIEEDASYYSYEKLIAARLLIHNNIHSVNNGEYKLEEYLKKYCFSECEDRLLFRLANRFKPNVIYVIGGDLGLAPIYLTAHSKSAHCVVFEPDERVASYSRLNIGENSSSGEDIHVSESPDIPDNIDFLVWGRCLSIAGKDVAFSLNAFEKYLPHINDESVMVISGINSSRENRNTWKKVRAHSRVTVTLDLYSLGIVFFNPKLHRKTYKSLVF